MRSRPRETQENQTTEVPEEDAAQTSPPRTVWPEGPEAERPDAVISSRRVCQQRGRAVRLCGTSRTPPNTPIGRHIEVTSQRRFPLDGKFLRVGSRLTKIDQMQPIGVSWQRQGQWTAP